MASLNLSGLLSHINLNSQSQSIVTAKVLLAGVTLQNASQTATSLEALGLPESVLPLIPGLANATNPAALATAVSALETALQESTSGIGSLLQGL